MFSKMYRYEFKSTNKFTGNTGNCYFNCKNDKEFKEKCNYWLENCNITNVRKFII